MKNIIIAIIASVSVSACLFSKKEETAAPAAEQQAPAEAAPAPTESAPAE